MNRASGALALALFTHGVSNAFLFASLPPIARQTGIGEAQVGLIITAGAVVFMAASPWWGARSQRIGRRPVMLVCLAAYALTTLLFGLVIEARMAGLVSAGLAFALLLAARALFAGTGGGLFPAAQAYMADVTDIDSRAAGMALLGMSVGLGMTVGPGIAALLASISLVAPIYAVAGLAAAALLCVHRWVAESRPPGEAPTRAHRWLPAPPARPYLIISFLLVASVATVQTVLAFWVQDVLGVGGKAATGWAGLALAFLSGGFVAAQAVFARLMGWPSGRLLAVGSILAPVAVAVLMLVPAYPAIVAACFLFGAGFGMIMPGNTAAMTLAVPLDQQGAVAGQNAAAQGFGFVIGPFASGALYQVAPAYSFAMALVLLLPILPLSVRLTARP